MTVLATTETWAAIGFSAAAALLLIGPALATAWFVVERCIADPTSYERAIDDVQRFIDLTEHSRAQLRSAPRLPLFDPAGADAVSAAIGRALTVKDAARQALWPHWHAAQRSRRRHPPHRKPAKASAKSGMKLHNRHERVIDATPECVAALLSDLAGIWPTEIAPAPKPLGAGRYDAGPMTWEEIDQVGAVRAFRVVHPPELRAQHWFELEPVGDRTRISHTVEGEAAGQYQAIWRDRIEALHDRILEALLDNLAAGTAVDERRPREPRGEGNAGACGGRNQAR